MDWVELRHALEGRRLPAAVVDLDALQRNVERVRRAVEGSGKTLRVASKSVRHTGLLRRILERGGPSFRGLLCFTAEEAAFLCDQGFDDLLVAYPTCSGPGLEAVCARVRAGRTVRVAVDGLAHLEAAGRAARAAGVDLGVVVDLDLAYRGPLGLRLGALRSPLATPAAVRALVAEVDRTPGLHLAGLLGYEAHLAGLPDHDPRRPLVDRAVAAFKALARPAAARLRASLRDAVGRELPLVNGGGTGSLRSALADPALTEVTAGSAFLCSHLFDRYDECPCEAAAYFVLEVSRVPAPGVATCLGGGYVASGAMGPDRLPEPALPPGLRLTEAEGAGEVQTPLRLAPDGPALGEGDPVAFRHAKAGELAERFATYLLVEGGRVVAEEPTYRGQGRCFL